MRSPLPAEGRIRVEAMPSRVRAGIPILLLLGVGICACTSPLRTSRAAKAQEPADSVQAYYLASIRAFRLAAGRFRTAAESLPATAAGNAALKSELVYLRESYKSMEFLVERLHPGSAVLLNGPPVDRIGRNNRTAIQPQGLQVLEQTLYAGALPGIRQPALELARQLEIAADGLLGFASALALDDRMICEAMENQVIRVMTLELAGFDSPAARRSLPEARISLEALRPALRQYLPHLKRLHPDLASRLENALDLAVARLEGPPDFDAFDRLDFLIQVGNPLYASLMEAHLALGVATHRQVPSSFLPVNPGARNLFAPDFLDPHAYSDVPGEKPDGRMAALGRILFFDPILSGDNRRACASCHRPEKAFSDGLAKSLAFFTPPSRTAGIPAPVASPTLQRSAPALVHAAYQSRQFWDVRANSLEALAEHVMASPQELHGDFSAILAKLRSSPEYVRLFEDAFPGTVGETVTAGSTIALGALTKSLAMFVRTLGRWDSPFDRYARGQSDRLDEGAKRGFNLFMGKAGCGTCHFPPAFNGTTPPLYVDTDTEVLGVPATADTLKPTLDADPGRYPRTLIPALRNSFKTPTVRNAALTGPYMHNGVFATLEEVMRFYNAGGGRGLGLEVPNQTLSPDSLGLTQGEIGDVIAFIGSLTDTAGLAGQKPGKLPAFPGRTEWNGRVAGGEY